MVTDTGFYFLSTTAQDIWRKNDSEGQSKMFESLTRFHKENFFRRVVYKSKTIPEYRLTEMAENVFLATWEVFNKNGVAGKIIFSGNTYTGYFFIAFKNNYLKALEKELKQVMAERVFGQEYPDTSEVVSGAGKPDLFSAKTQMILEKISPDCKQLLIWKHIEGLSHDEIAGKKNINRNSSIKMVSRCGKRFSEIWQNKFN